MVVVGRFLWVGDLSWEGLQVRHFLTCCGENHGKPYNYTLHIPDGCKTSSKHISVCAFFEGGKSSHHFEYGGFTELAAEFGRGHKTKPI